MHFPSQISIWLLASIASAAAQAESSEACTTTISEQARCCPPASSSTETSYVDCDGCALATTTTGIMCFMLCPATPSTVPGTTTVTSCSTLPDCTSTITTTAPFGCTITVPPKTSTSSIDCDGCALDTETVVNPRLGRGPVCVGGRKTVTGSTGTATVTACLAETET